MIRLIDLRASSIGDYAFAWIIEETDCFLVINGSQAWDGWIDFAQDCRSANKEEILATLRPLCPEWLEQEIRSHDIRLITNSLGADTMIIDDPLAKELVPNEYGLAELAEWWEGSGVYKKRRQENNEGSVDWTGA